MSYRRTTGGSSRYVVSRRLGEGQYWAPGTNDHTVINQALSDASSGGTRAGAVILMEGQYNCAGKVVLPDSPNLTLRGVSKSGTSLVFNNLTGTDLIGRTDVTTNTRYTYEISSLTIDNQSRSNAGAIGVNLDNLSNCVLRDVLITNVAEAIRLYNRAYFNQFYNVDFQTVTTGVRIGGTIGSNENRFWGLKCTDLVDYPVIIESGNDNHFTACSFEDFLTAVEISDIGNHFISCRFECNDITGTILHVKLNSAAKNNSFISPYFAGNKWVDRATNIVDNGAGNCFLAFSGYKDQFFRAERNVTAADDMVYMKRSGSGDAKAVYVADDTYSASGAPISFLAKQVRTGSKFFQGLLSGVQKFAVYSDGSVVVGGAVDNQWGPAVYGFKSWAYDPVVATTQTAPTAGTMQIVRLMATEALTTSNVYLNVGTAGVATANAYVAIYQNGTLVAQSADISSTLNSTGIKTVSLSASVAAGTFYVAFWVGSATTVPAFSRGAGVGLPNAKLGTNYRYATADTGLTTTAPGTMGAKTTGTIAYWVGVD